MYGVSDAALQQFAVRLMRSVPHMSPDTFSDKRVAERGFQLTLWAFGVPCSLPLDGVTTPPSSGGHVKHPGFATSADLCVQLRFF